MDMPRKLPNNELKRLSPQVCRESPKLPVVLVLDNIRSQHNIGAAFRTADAFSVEKIYLCGICAVPPSAEIHKSALGAEEVVEWSYCESTTDAVQQLQREAYSVWSVEQVEGSCSLDRFFPLYNKRYALVFGNEVRGVQQEVVDLSNGWLEIPQFGTKHSLNVSVSIGVVMWDFWVKLHR